MSLDNEPLCKSTLSLDLHNLNRVMECLKVAAVTLRQMKCVFPAPSVEYLGHVIDKDGLHPSPEKVCAIQDVPEPRNLTKLKSC